MHSSFCHDEIQNAVAQTLFSNNQPKWMREKKRRTESIPIVCRENACERTHDSVSQYTRHHHIIEQHRTSYRQHSALQSLTFQSSNEGLFFKVKSSHENNNQIDYRIHLNWSQRVRNIFSNSGHTFTHRTRKKLTHILSIGTNTHAQTHPSMSNNAK